MTRATISCKTGQDESCFAGLLLQLTYADLGDQANPTPPDHTHPPQSNPIILPVDPMPA